MTLTEYTDIKNTVINALDKAIAEGDWEASLFFRNIGKKLQQVRDNFVRELAEEEKAEQVEEISAIPQAKVGYQKIYISLYQAQDDNVERWQQSVKALAEYNISRPVYGEEGHMMTLIRAKTDRKREAYVVAQVPEDCVLPPYPGLPTEDKFGHALLSIKERSIRLENILEFVHGEARYHIIDGKLVQNVESV